MKGKNICVILIIFIVIFIIGVKENYCAIGKNINKTITKWVSGGFTGWTEEMTQQKIEEILSNLKKDFNYEGNTINNEMRMLTKISVEEKKRNGKYKIRIRNRDW